MKLKVKISQEHSLFILDVQLTTALYSLSLGLFRTDKSYNKYYKRYYLSLFRRSGPIETAKVFEFGRTDLYKAEAKINNAKYKASQKVSVSRSVANIMTCI